MDIPYKFWKKFVEGDILSRRKQLKIIVNRFMALDKIDDKKLKQQTLEIGLLSYFEDLIEYMEIGEETDDGLGEDTVFTKEYIKK